jgi:hypothetical protein
MTEKEKTKKGRSIERPFCFADARGGYERE